MSELRDISQQTLRQIGLLAVPEESDIHHARQALILAGPSAGRSRSFAIATSSLRESVLTILLLQNRATAAWFSNMQDFNLVFGGPIKEIAAAAPCLSAASQHVTTEPPRSLKLLSWNLLAPPYNRRSGERESDAAWRSRAAEQIAHVAASEADVVGLQEFWTESEEHILLWRDFAAAGGYTMHVLPRTDGKRDGCAMLVRLPGSSCRFSAFTYSDWGSRVCQMAELSFDGRPTPFTLLQTHLTFPHDSAHDPPMRQHQGRKLAELVRELANMCTDICVFGDLNGDLEDAAVKTLTSLGGLRTPPAPQATVGEGANDWVSHVAHTGDLMACDLVLTRGACRVADWRLAGSREELVKGRMPSDHRPVHATLSLEAEAADAADQIQMH